MQSVTTSENSESPTIPQQTKEQSSNLFADAPIQRLLDLRLVEMSQEQLQNYVSELHLLRVSAPTFSARVKKDSGEKKSGEISKLKKATMVSEYLS